MSKKKLLKARTLLYPMPAVIVGASINGKANFCTIAFCGIVHLDPPMLSIECSPKHYTTPGIIKNKEFSVNIPSVNMVEITDYIGIKSGKIIDKSDLFTIFYSDLKNAPLIEEAPVNHACKLVKIVELAGSKDLYIGEIVNTYVNEDCLTKEAPDIKKINPIIYATSNRSYWSLGKEIGKAWKIGRNYNN
ncbi:MAG: flavin reductase family protein [Promethearchaeota archaeon]